MLVRGPYQSKANYVSNRGPGDKVYCLSPGITKRSPLVEYRTPMTETKKRNQSTRDHSVREAYSQPYVVPETAIRDLALNLRVGQAQDASMCLLIIEEAVRAIENKTGARDLNFRLIEQIVSQEQCRPIQPIVQAILSSIGQGTEGIHASCLTITRFLEFAFGYQPDPNVAERRYKVELSKIRRGTNAAGIKKENWKVFDRSKTATKHYRASRGYSGDDR